MATVSKVVITFSDGSVVTLQGTPPPKRSPWDESVPGTPAKDKHCKCCRCRKKEEAEKVPSRASLWRGF